MNVFYFGTKMPPKTTIRLCIHSHILNTDIDICALQPLHFGPKIRIKYKIRLVNFERSYKLSAEHTHRHTHTYICASNGKNENN